MGVVVSFLSFTLSYYSLSMICFLLALAAVLTPQVSSLGYGFGGYGGFGLSPYAAGWGLGGFGYPGLYGGLGYPFGMAGLYGGLLGGYGYGGKGYGKGNNYGNKGYGNSRYRRSTRNTPSHHTAIPSHHTASPAHHSAPSYHTASPAYHTASYHTASPAHYSAPSYYTATPSYYSTPSYHTATPAYHTAPVHSVHTAPGHKAHTYAEDLHYQPVSSYGVQAYRPFARHQPVRYSTPRRYGSMRYGQQPSHGRYYVRQPVRSYSGYSRINMY